MGGEEICHVEKDQVSMHDNCREILSHQFCHYLRIFFRKMCFVAIKRYPEISWSSLFSSVFNKNGIFWPFIAREEKWGEDLVVSGPPVVVPARPAGEQKTLAGPVKVFALSGKNFIWKQKYQKVKVKVFALPETNWEVNTKQVETWLDSREGLQKLNHRCPRSPVRRGRARSIRTQTG